MWASRLIVDELELSDIKNVERYCENLRSLYPRIHILINNAAQTITRPTGWLNRMDTVNKNAYQMLTCGEDSLHSEWNVLSREGKNETNCFIKDSNWKNKIDLISTNYDDNENNNHQNNNNNDNDNNDIINGSSNSNSNSNKINNISRVTSKNGTSTMESNTNSLIARDLGSDSRILTLDDSAQPLDKSGE